MSGNTFGTPAMPPPMPAAGANEHSPILGSAGGNETVLVLSTHARVGRYVNMLTASIFLFGFHAGLISIGYMHYDLPCDRPLAPFLLAAGVVGAGATCLYLMLEMRRSQNESLLLPTEAAPPAAASDKLLVLVALVAAIGVATFGAVMYPGAPGCAYTNPIVYNWTLAALLLYGCFGGLVVIVPVLGVIFPFCAVALLPLIASLVALANWLSEAGKRGAYGAASALRRWLARGSGSEQTPSPMSVAHPASTFALYVNTAALLWLFGFMLIEVGRSWRLPCDAPLKSFVLVAAALGISLALTDFVADVFKDGMPPVTKLEQTAAKEDRKRKLRTYGWLLGIVLIWGACGLLWLGGSETCAHTAPAVYRLALLLGLVYAIFVGLLLLIVAALAVDFCLSGKLRMVVILEQ